MLSIGSYVRVTRDAASDEPLMEGMVGRVVADVYGRTDPASQALVVMAGARKPCAVPLEALEPISEDDYGDEASSSRILWKQRRQLWRKRHGRLPSASADRVRDEDAHAAGSDDDERDPLSLPGSREVRHRLEVVDLIRRSEAVQPEEITAIASPSLLALLTEWAVGALDVLCDLIPPFGDMTYREAREVRTEHIERWLWEGVRLYLAIRSYHTHLPPVTAAPSRERVRSLFERIDDGAPAERLAAFSLDVGAVKKTMAVMAGHWLREAEKTFARSLAPESPQHEELARYILQLHIAGYQAGFCCDSAHHAIPAH